MSRRIKSCEQLFYDEIYNMVKNLIVKDINYNSQYYHELGVEHLIESNISKGEFILEKMENVKHLIIWEEE